MLMSVDNEMLVRRSARAAGGKGRIVLLQTQAEAAGAQEISRILGQGLAERGFDVHHVFLYRRTAVFDRQPNTRFCVGERPSNPRALAAMTGTLLRSLRELRPDALLAFQHYGNILGAAAAKLAGVPVVIANRTSAKALEPRWTRAFDLGFGVTGLFDRVVVNCEAVADEYRSFPRSYRARLRRIDHGFEVKRSTLPKTDARALFNLPADAILIGSVGRLHPTKNLAEIVKLLCDRNWHAAIAGQGPARDALCDLAEKLDVSERLHLIGELPAERVGDFLRALDVFAFPSLMETFGLAAVEAAAAGVPVVANDLAVLREVLAAEGLPAALFADANNERAFGEAVARVLDDERLRADLICRGQALSERFSLDKMVERYADLIGEAVAERGMRRQPA